MEHYALISTDPTPTNYDPAVILPLEIFTKVLRHIWYPNIISMRRVSRSWRDRVDDFLEAYPIREYDVLEYRDSVGIPVNVMLPLIQGVILKSRTSA